MAMNGNMSVKGQVPVLCGTKMRVFVTQMSVCHQVFCVQSGAFCTATDKIDVSVILVRYVV